MNNHNYFGGSEGAFKAIPSSWTRKMIETADQARLGLAYGWPEIIRLGNHRWHRNFVSWSNRCGSLSVYYISENEQFLLRVSDHWSETKCTGRAVGNIRRCRWTLTGTSTQGIPVKGDILGPDCQGLPWSWHYEAVLTGGIIAFKDLHER